MKKVVIVLGALLLFALQGFAQQEQLFSQYTMNKFLINPAFAGHEGYTAYNLTARQQWLGFEDAPSTQAISGQARILKTSYISKSRSIKSRSRRRRPSGKVGIGGYIFNDMNGIVARTGGQFTYAYHLFVGQGQLSFGVSLVAYQFRIDKDQITTYDPNDPLIDGNEDNLFIPDGNFGIYFSQAGFFAGLSATQLFQSALKFGSDNTFSNYKMYRQYYLMTGYRYDFGNSFEIEPSVLIKTNENLNIQADINVRGFYKKDYWLGFSYRTGDSFVTMVGIRIDKILVGYAFDYSLSDIQRISYGSHEIMIGLRFGDNARRYRWLNRF